MSVQFKYLIRILCKYVEDAFQKHSKFTILNWHKSLTMALLLSLVAIISIFSKVEYVNAQTPANLTLTWKQGTETTIDSVPSMTSTPTDYDDPVALLVMQQQTLIRAVARSYINDSDNATQEVNVPPFAPDDRNIGIRTFKYGHWKAHFASRARDGNCERSEICGDFAFIPNNEQIDNYVGQNIRYEITLFQLDRDPNNPSQFNERQGSVSISVTIRGQSEVSFDWDSDVTGEIERDQSTTYSDLEGTITLFHKVPNFQVITSATESKNGATATNSMSGSEDSTAGFMAIEHGTNFNYGSWFVASGNDRLLFRPEATAINALLAGDVVKSILTIKITNDSNANDVFKTGMIEVNISHTIGLSVTWVSERTLETITAVSGKTDYANLEGKISLSNSPTSTIVVGASVVESQTTGMPKNSDTLTTSTTRMGYKFIGTDEATSSFTFGNWFIQDPIVFNDNSNEIIFVPNHTAISALTYGQSISITLEVIISVMEGSSQSPSIRQVDSQMIQLKISPPVPTAQVSFNINRSDNVVINQNGSNTYTVGEGMGQIQDYDNSLRTNLRFFEQKNNEQKIEVDFQGQTDTRGDDIWLISDRNATYGIWYELAQSQTDNIRFDFRPNAMAINDNLQEGDVVRTWLEYLICSSNCIVNSQVVESVVLSRAVATVTIFARGDPKVNLTWNTDFSGKVTKRIDSNTVYQDQVGTIASFKISSQDQYKVRITEDKEGAPTITENSGSQNSDIGFEATQYEGNLAYGSWFIATDNSKFVFKPNSTEINRMRPGETVTSTLSVNVVGSDGTTNIISQPVTRSYTIEAPNAELNWNPGNTGLIRQSQGATNYGDIRGEVTSSFLPTPHHYSGRITETIGSTVQVTSTSSLSSDGGFEGVLYEENLDYGVWYFAADNSQFLFRPNVQSINNLSSNDSVTSTLQVTPIDSSTGVRLLSEPVSITVTIVGTSVEIDLKPEISIITAARNVKSGDTLLFTVESDINLISPLQVGITYPESEDQIMWRIPRYVNLDTSSRRTQLQIQTVKRYTAEDTTIDFKVAIAENNDDYQRSDSDREVTVQLARTGESSGNPARLSVADAAVNSILDFVNNPNNSQPSSSVILPRFSIYADTREIQEGESLRLSMVSDMQVSSPVSVNLEIDQHGNVVESANHQIVFPANQSSINVAIPTIDDNLVENDVILGIRIVSGSYYKLGVNNSIYITVSDSKDRERKRRGYLDSVNQSIMHAFMEQTGIDTFNVVSERANHVLFQNRGSKFEFGKNDGLSELFATGNDLFIENQPLRSSLVGQSSFSLELFPENGIDGFAEIWGFGDYQTIQKGRGDIGATWDGDMYLANVGTDARLNHNMLAGLAYSYSDSIIEFSSYDGSSVNHFSEFHGISPYLSWNSTKHRANLQVISSFKQGRIEISHDGFETVTLDNSMFVFGLGGSKNLHSIDTFYSNSPINFDLNGEAWTVQLFPTSTVEDFSDTKLESSQFNIALEGSQGFTIGDYLSASPALSIGFQGTQDTLQSDAGYEFESSVEFTSSNGYTFSSEGQIFQNHRAATRNWGINSQFDYDKFHDNLGLQIQLDHSLVQAQSTPYNTNWSHKLINRNNSFQNSERESEMNLKLSYGIKVLDNSSILTPISNIRFDHNKLNRIQIGSRITLGQDLEFGLIGSHNSNSKNITSQQINLNGQITW